MEASVLPDIGESIKHGCLVALNASFHATLVLTNFDRFFGQYSKKMQWPIFFWPLKLNIWIRQVILDECRRDCPTTALWEFKQSN